MRHINGAYTTYFNVKRKRSGHLFQGRYKAILVEVDEYLAELSRYIHLNPVRAGIVERPEQFQWSSSRSYAGYGSVPEWLKTGFILGCFSQETEDARIVYQRFVEELLGKEYISPLNGAIGASLLGGSAFVNTISARYLQGKVDENIPALRQLAGRSTPEEIICAVKAQFVDDRKLARRAAIYLCHKQSGVRLREIGELFNLRDTAISEASRRFAREIELDEKLKGVVSGITTKLKICRT